MFYPLANKQFYLAKVGLVRAALPRELTYAPGNCVATNAIVLMKNSDKFGTVNATGYTPKAIVVAGGMYRTNLLTKGHVYAWAFVEKGALEINAAEAFTCSDFMGQLNDSLNRRFFGQRMTAMTGQAWPYITEVFPFENNMVFQYRGNRYGQRYTVDPVDRRVALDGMPEKLLSKSMQAADAKTQMPLSQTGARYAYAPPMGQLQTFTTGGRSSELITQWVRNMANVDEAVAMYLAHARNGRTPMRPAFSPVELTPDGKIQRALTARGIYPYDFAAWASDVVYQAAASKTKSHGGDDVPMSKHAYVGDPKDPSTWHLPIDNEGRTRAALARVNQTKGIPQAAKPGVLKKIRHAAARHGMDISKKPTPGQKDWAAGVDPVWA